MAEFEESGMVFSFADENLFHIEDCDAYQQTLKSKGIRSVECVALGPAKQVFFIEAKTSAPAPNGERGQERFEEFLAEIRSKNLHSLLFTYAVLHRLQEIHEQPIGQTLQGVLQHAPKIVFLLIVRTHQMEWCIPLRDALHKKMADILSLWNAELLVVNEEFAKRNGLIL